MDFFAEAPFLEPPYSRNFPFAAIPLGLAGGFVGLALWNPLDSDASRIGLFGVGFALAGLAFLAVLHPPAWLKPGWLREQEKRQPPVLPPAAGRWDRAFDRVFLMVLGGLSILMGLVMLIAAIGSRPCPTSAPC